MLRFYFLILYERKKFEELIVFNLKISADIIDALKLKQKNFRLITNKLFLACSIKKVHGARAARMNYNMIKIKNLNARPFNKLSFYETLSRHEKGRWPALKSSIKVPKIPR